MAIEVLGHKNGSSLNFRNGESLAGTALFLNGDRGERINRLMRESADNSLQKDPQSFLSLLRQALILAAKLSRQNAKNYDPKQASPLCHRSADVGMMLTLAEMPREVVVAGFLHNALRGAEGSEYERRRTVIDRKFVKKGGLDADVLYLVDLVAPAGESALPRAAQESRQLSRIETSGPEFAALFCAIKASEIATSRETSLETLLKFERAFAAQRVPVLLQDQFRMAVLRQHPNIELLTVGDAGVEGVSAALNMKDVMFIRNGMQLSSRFFSREKRTRGIGETVPLNSHSCEVGFLLLSAGQDKELVVAGLCHDFEEQYVLKANVEKLREYIGKNFGPRVLRLIHAQSEPPKCDQTAGNWLERKTAVLEKIAAGESDEATLCCAAKISTFGNGNKWLKACLKAGERDVEKATLGWSKGNHTENLTFAMRLLDVFERKEVPLPLLDQYEHEVRRFLRFRRLYEQAQA